MTSIISSNNHQNPGYVARGRVDISYDQLKANEENYKLIKNTPQDFLYQYGSASIAASNLPQKTNSLYSTNQVSDKRELGLSALSLEKVELSLGITTASEEVSRAINKQVINSISDILKEFNLASSAPKSIKNYTQGNALEYANALINQGAHQIIKQGGTAKKLDDYLYSMSQRIDETVDELKNIYSDKVSVVNDQLMGLPTTATLRVWQQRDEKVEVVSQTFNITNSDGDVVEIKASYSNSKSTQTDDYNNTTKQLDVEISNGSLNQAEQDAFNKFLDDFSKVTNAILAGDENLANEAFSHIDPSDYGFQSIEKISENSWGRYNNDKVLHIYEEEHGHNSASGTVRGRFDGFHQDKSFIQGGELHGTYRSSVADLGAFNIKFANTHEKATSGISSPVGEANDTSYMDDTWPVLGLNQNYGKGSDGLILQDESGQLFRYEYNKKDRDSSGWRKIDNDLVDLKELQIKDYFNKIRLEIIKETGQVLVNDTTSGKIVTADTKLAFSDNKNSGLVKLG